jgi:hypothetical protein
MKEALDYKHIKSEGFQSKVKHDFRGRVEFKNLWGIGFTEKAEDCLIYRLKNLRYVFVYSRLTAP